MGKFNDGGSDSEDGGSFIGSKFNIRKNPMKTLGDNSDSEDEYSDNRAKFGRKGPSHKFEDSDDSGDENPYPKGNREPLRAPQMAEFFKFQQKKIPGFAEKLFSNRGRGSSFDGREDAHLPKGYHSKMVATAYTSDTE
jgi:hypothetical protein